MNIFDKIKELENRLLIPEITPKRIILIKNSILELKLEYIKDKIESELTEEVFLSSGQLFYCKIMEYQNSRNVLLSIFPINLEKIELDFKECFSLYKKNYFQHQDQFNDFNSPDFNRFVFDKFKSNFSIDDSNKLYQRKKYIIYKKNDHSIFKTETVYFSFKDIEPLFYISYEDNNLSLSNIDTFKQLNYSSFLDVYFDKFILAEKMINF